MDQDEKDTYLCDTVHNSPGLNMLDCPVHNLNESWLMMMAFGVSFLLFGSGIYLFFMPINLELTERTESGVKREEYKLKPVDLDEDEAKVYDLLKEREGSMYQSDLIRETSFSKVHMTRVLDKMESRKIVERKRRGMTNIIVLK
jgi:uncharacterized membrane protein